MNFDSISPLPPLLQEVAKQTAPENYMEPYDAARVKRATELNAQVFEIDNRKPIKVLNLLESTINDLGCSYPAVLVYQYLLSMYNPTNNRKNFDWCNELCQKLYNIKDDVMAMILLVKQETEKREEILRQERIKIEQQEAQKSRESLRTTGIVLGSIIGIFVLFFAIYIPIDYHRVNKRYPRPSSEKMNTISVIKEQNKSNKSCPSQSYICDIPHMYVFYNQKDNAYYYDFVPEHGMIQFDITKKSSLSISPEVKRLEQKGFNLVYNFYSDTTIWFTYDKYSLEEGRLTGNCIYMLKPSPFKATPFPKCADENITIRCEGYGMTKSIADSIGNSLRVKWNNASDSLYATSLACKKYRMVKNDDKWLLDKSAFKTDLFYQMVSFKSPIKWNKMLIREHYDEYSDWRRQNLLHSEELLLTPDMDAGIWICLTSDALDRKLEDITIGYPVDSIKVTSSAKCTISGNNAIKTEAVGYYEGTEYKYFVYQIVKDNGYSEYKEPIYGTEVRYLSKEDIASYKQFHLPIPQNNREERTVIKGYKNTTSQKKNDDVYVCLIFGMTPEWYENNLGTIDSIVESIKIEDVVKMQQQKGLDISLLL